MPGILTDEDCCQGIMPGGDWCRGGRALKTRPPYEDKGQEWSATRRFPGRTIIDEEPALKTASEWSRPDTVWTDNSRQGSGTVGAACVWRTQDGWTGRRYYLGTKEGFDAETFAIY